MIIDFEKYGDRFFSTRMAQIKRIARKIKKKIRGIRPIREIRVNS